MSRLYKSVFLCLLLGLALLTSCNYEWMKEKSVDGKTVWTKFYKDPTIREIKYIQSFFKRQYHEQNFFKYPGKITTDTINHSTFIQFDSERVYLFFDSAAVYKTIFTSGLVTSQMIYCELDSLCRPVADFAITMIGKTEPEKMNLWGWYGPTIKIDHFEELTYLHCKRTQRRFLFWVYPEKFRINGGDYFYVVELTNPAANRKTDIQTFIKGARVSFLKRLPWSMI